MNLKNPGARYWVVGSVVLLVGIGVFCLLRFSVKPVIAGKVAREVLPNIQAAERHLRVRSFMGALRARQWQKLPTLAIDCLRRPSVEVHALANDKILLVTKSKFYVLRNSGTNWSDRLEGPSQLVPLLIYLNAHPTTGCHQGP
jgi:hypothetical protein